MPSWRWFKSEPGPRGCMLPSEVLPECRIAIMTTAYITHPDCLRHEMGPGHPESPARLGAINEHMRTSGMLDELRCLEAPLADEDALKRVHRPSYVDSIFDNAPTEGYAQL